MTRKTRNRLLAHCIVTLPFIVLIGFILLNFLAPPPPFPPMPSHNGYADLVQAGGLVSTRNEDFDTATLERLRETTAANADALALARAGFTNECRVPVQFNPAFSAGHLSDLTRLKLLAQAFVMEGRLAEMENRPEAAARSYLDVIRLGNESTRGGLLIDQLVGMAISDIGISHLQKIADQLEAKPCHEAAAELETLDAQAPTWDEIMQSETIWSRRTFTGLRNEIMRLINGNTLKKTLSKTKNKFEQRQLERRQLIIKLAVRDFTLEKGHPPATFSDLLPDFIKAIPQDPFTGTNIVYSP